MWKRTLVCGVLAFLFGWLALWLAPRQARKLREPFVKHGQQTTGIVTAKAVVRKSYEGGGGDSGTKTYRERSVTVRIPREADRQVEIDTLVLKRDYNRLQIGDEVSITYIHAKDTKRGPYYLLSSSVDAGMFALLPWAFDGRPASGLAIWAAIPAIITFILFVGFLIDALRRKATLAR